MNKPKILYLITQAEWGGAQRYVFDLAIAFKTEFDVSIAAGAENGDDSLLRRSRDNGIRTVEISNLHREIRPIEDIRALLKIRSLLKELKPQILHLNSAKAAVLGTLAAAWTGIKIVYTVHGWSFLEPLSIWKKAAYLIFEKISCSFGREATILLSQKELAAAKKYGLNCGETEIIFHGIAPPAFLDKETALQKLNEHLQKPLPKNALLIGTVANLYETKDIANLIEALKGVNENFISIVIGTGPLFGRLKTLIEEEKLSNRVILAGKIIPATEILKSFDIFVLPSAKEGFPYAILEAMAAGLPIAATSVGAIPEMIEDKKSGLIAPPKNPGALKTAIESLLKDENLRSLLGQTAANEFKIRFSKDKMVQATKEIYLKFLSDSSKSREI
ncbi:glycosyltransferase [Candidatus Uhrbacteria bacterium]|nr:glycosyltransferase [Candidatus Uhrbacteria bacterium]